MKKLAVCLMLSVMFFAAISAGCGGGSDNAPADSEQTESLNDDTGDYDTNEEGRGTSGATVDLSTLSANYTAQDGEILTGALRANVKISIADGATVTISDVTISGENSISYNWAGLNCSGDATIILEGSNDIKGFYSKYPGIYVSKGELLPLIEAGAS